MNTPDSRVENILQTMLGSESPIEKPASRVESLLSDIKDLLSEIENKVLYKHYIKIWWYEDSTPAYVLCGVIINNVAEAYNGTSFISVRDDFIPIGFFDGASGTQGNGCYAVIKKSSSNYFDVMLLDFTSEPFSYEQYPGNWVHSIQDIVTRLI